MRLQNLFYHSPCLLLICLIFRSFNNSNKFDSAYNYLRIILIDQMHRKNMRLLVLGDENVGKSSLIHTIYSQVSSNVERTLKKVILPPEMCLYSKQMFTELVDTSVDMQITAEVRAADLVLLVYDVSDPETIARIQSDWLPKINQINPKIPIILVGNKMDKKQLEIQNEHEYTNIKDILKKVTKRYKNVQMGIECSAFYDRNVKSVLNCAQRAVLYPLAPLYNLQERKITIGFEKALTRIFRILDQDFDGKLHDPQMNALQERVFQTELNVEDIKAIKQIIIKQLQVQQHDYIELKGFVALQKKVIQMLKIQICWSILRHFNYDNNMRINVNTYHFIIDQSIGQSVQLSSEAISFLINIYHICKKKCGLKEQDSKYLDQDQKIIQKIFQPCPSVEFEQFSEFKDMSQQKFLTTWSLYAFVNYRRCYEDLLYIGYQKSIDQTFVRRRNKQSYSDFQKLKENKVFSIIIIDNQNYQDYIQPLFCQAKTITLNRSIKSIDYQRTSVLFKNNIVSKTFLLFKVQEKDIPDLFGQQIQNDTSFFKSTDLIIQFQAESNRKIKIDIPNVIPSHCLYRRISHKEALTVLNADKPPKLNLNSIPIRYEEDSYSIFFNEIIFKVFQNIQSGLTKSKIQQLKDQKNKKKNMILLSTVSVAIALAILGTILVKKFKIKV